MKLKRITNIQTRRSQRAALGGLNLPKNEKRKKTKPGHLNIQKHKFRKKRFNNFLTRPKFQAKSRDTAVQTSGATQGARGRSPFNENIHIVYRIGVTAGRPNTGGNSPKRQSTGTPVCRRALQSDKARETPCVAGLCKTTKALCLESF